ncbi:MAG TPA: hypothetical protein DIC42_02275 [Holosporales bacterium]|nr:hypothetical protein [Holosporales bacterium]
MKRLKFLKLCRTASAFIAFSSHHMQATAMESAELTPCSRFVGADKTPISIGATSIAQYFDSPQALKAFTNELTASVNTFLEGTWRLKPDDYRSLEEIFGLFLRSMDGLGEPGLSPEEKQNQYNSALDRFCTQHEAENKFATKEWLNRYTSISHKCLPKPEKKPVLTNDDTLNAQLAIRFHFVLPDSWIEVLVDTAVRTDPLQMHRYFFEEATVKDNPQFFLRYELLGNTRLHPIGTDTLNAFFSSNYKPDLVEQVWRYLRRITRPIYRDLQLNVLFTEEESLLTEEQFKILLENNTLPPYPKTEEQAKKLFDILHRTEYSEEQKSRLQKYDMTNAIQFCLAAAEAVAMHFENVKMTTKK